MFDRRDSGGPAPAAGPELADLSAAELVARARGALVELAARSTWQLSETELIEALGGSLSLESVLAAARSRLVGDVQSRELRLRTQAPSTERWLSTRFRISRAQANELVREADALGAEPAVRAALASSLCTPEQASVITSTLASLPALDDATRDRATHLLVDQCAALDPIGLARAGRHLHERLTTTPDADDPVEQARVEADAQSAADHARALRSLTWRTHADGSVTGRFRLDPLGGQTLLTAVSALTARRDVPPSPGDPGTDAAEAQGLLDPPTKDVRTLTHRRADALVTLAGRALERGDVPSRGGIAPTVVVTTTLEALEGRVAATGALPYGGRLDASSLRRLACDAQVIPVVLGGGSQVLDLGRGRRLFSPAQRRALAVRDGGCVQPGCGAPAAECEAHHMTGWAQGGRTDVDNGALLCDFDHDRHHREGWQLRLDDRGLPVVVPPASIDPARRPRQHIRFLASRLRT